MADHRDHEKEREAEYWISALTEMSHEYDEEVVQLRTEIQELRRSTSWKITKPLRVAVKAARAIRTSLRKHLR